MNAQPHLALLGTGGTIAGTHHGNMPSGEYLAGALPAQGLQQSIPELAGLARWHIVDCLALDSKDMQPAHWLLIARAAKSLLQREDIDGLVITHGTDTLEETALFLDLVLTSPKPVVITGAMRPASAVAADGPANLLDAARLAAHPGSGGRGVLICFGEYILPPQTTRKQHAFELNAFASSHGAIGRTRPTVRFFLPPPPKVRPAFSLPDGALPTVEILHLSAGSDPALARAATQLGSHGIVLALPGNGSVPDTWEQPLAQLTQAGTVVVRASRCADSDIRWQSIDTRIGTWPAGVLSPAGARVALMLALAQKTPHDDAARALFTRIAGSAEEQPGSAQS